VRDVGRATMETLHEDLVNLVPVLQQSATLHGVVGCHQKAMLVASAKRVSLAKDVTGRSDTLSVLTEAWGKKHKWKSQS